MPQTYLVTTDMSPRSDRALRRAFALARQHGARLIVLAVVDDAAPADIAGSLVERTRSELTRMIATLGADDVQADLRVQHGDPTGDILAAAADTDADLLIMGTHRERPFLDALRETTVQRITRLTACPVLMVASRVENGYETVVAGTDFSPAAAAVIALAARIAPDAAIVPVHALHLPYKGVLAHTGSSMHDLEKAFRKEAEALDADWRGSHTLPDGVQPTRIVEGGAFGCLCRTVHDTGATLIAVGAHGKVGQYRAILGSTATDLMRSPPCDVLIARPNKS